MREEARFGARSVCQQPHELALQLTIRHMTQLPEFPIVHERTLTRRFLCSARALERLLDDTMTSQLVDDAKGFQSTMSHEHATRKPRSRSNSRALLLGCVKYKTNKMDHAAAGVSRC